MIYFINDSYRPAPEEPNISTGSHVVENNAREPKAPRVRKPPPSLIGVKKCKDPRKLPVGKNGRCVKQKVALVAEIVEVGGNTTAAVVIDGPKKIKKCRDPNKYPIGKDGRCVKVKKPVAAVVVDGPQGDMPAIAVVPRRADVLPKKPRAKVRVTKAKVMDTRDIPPHMPKGSYRRGQGQKRCYRGFGNYRKGSIYCIPNPSA